MYIERTCRRNSSLEIALFNYWEKVWYTLGKRARAFGKVQTHVMLIGVLKDKRVQKSQWGWARGICVHESKAFNRDTRFSKLQADLFALLTHTRWSNLKKRISLGKQRMGPCIQSQSQTITADLAQFGQHYSSLHARFEYSECLRHDCGSEVMREGVRGVERELRDLQSEACNLIELQELLGTSVFNFSLLNE